MKKVYLFILLLLLTACSSHTALSDVVLEQEKSLTNLAESKSIQVFDSPYLGGSMRVLDSRTPELDRDVTLSQHGDIMSIIKSLGDMFPSLTFQVSNDNGASAAKYRIYYEGVLKGLLDSIATQTGYGWTYDSNTITFSRIISKTYQLYVMPGKNSYINTITNENKPMSGSTPGGEGISQTVSTETTDLQTAQSTSKDLEIDAFEEIVIAVQKLLSKEGTVSVNSMASTITVHDTADKVLLVDRYIDKINEKLARQVAIQVQVWAVTLSDDKRLGLDLSVLFEDATSSVVTGGISALTNNISATIMSGNLKGSTATLQALKEWGNASSITSGSGIVMSNHFLPVLAVSKNAYMAGVSSTTDDYGKMTTLTPGEVTTGFSMNVIPNILENREVMLSYNVNLSSLDEMKEFSSGDTSIEMPQISSRAFSNTMRMKMGQTLILAGFQQNTQSGRNSIGFLSGGHNKNQEKTLLIVTISLENADI